MKDRDKIGLVAFAFGAAFVVSGCGVLEKVADSSFEYKATLDTNGALVNCHTNTNPVAKTEQGKTKVIFDRAFCFDKTPNAREKLGMSLSEPFSGEVTVTYIGVIEKPLVATSRP
jgi:hypothetical protein